MKKVALFDFNGTLLNDNDLWYDSMCEVFKKHGKVPPTVAEYFYEMDGDWHKVYTSRGIDASADELNETYIPYYESRMHEPDLFSGVLVMLKILSYYGYGIGLITGQPEELVTPLLKKFEIDRYFDPRFSSMQDRNKKDTIQKVLLVSGVDKQNCFYIGDSPSDIKHGNHAGIQTVGFLNGFIPESLVLDKKPNHVVGTIPQLTDFLI